MTDYHVLHAIHVANSNSWYHLWVQDSYIQENLALTLTLFQNTQTSLFGLAVGNVMKNITLPNKVALLWRT
jgi:hypothetical protein